jgi:hypothetical protein
LCARRQAIAKIQVDTLQLASQLGALRHTTSMVSLTISSMSGGLRVLRFRKRVSRAKYRWYRRSKASRSPAAIRASRRASSLSP